MTKQLSLVMVLAAACGDDGGAAAIDAPDGGARTLASCTTSIADDAPAFYKTYFRCVTITTTSTGVAITTDDLPPHLSYYWGASSPNYTAFDTRGGSYHANPNTLSAQTITIDVPSAPTPSGATISAATVDETAGTSQEEYALGPVGVALDSVALFTGTAAPGDDIANERFTFDGYEGHPEQRGAYHYHGPAPGPLEVLTAAGKSGELYGIMCDGTLVLGCAELDGSAATGLDAQGGHVGDITADGTTYFTGRYHTHVCATGHLYTPEIHYYAACTR